MQLTIYKGVDKNSKMKVYPCTKKWKHSVHKKFVIDQNVIRSIIFLKITVQQMMSANTVLVYRGIR